MDEIAEVIELLYNVEAAMKMPLAPELHFEALKETIPYLTERLLKAYLEMGGENHWNGR